MKKVILFAASILAFTTTQAQDFKTVLQKTVFTFDTSKDLQTKVEYSNKLGLIAKKWDNEWITHYYNAYSKTILSYNEKDEAKRDAYIDQADDELKTTTSLLGKETDETDVLAALIANARLAVKPQARWQTYGKIFREDLEKAQAINADNPRIYFLEGMSKYHTPKMFGGGKKAAMPYLEKADTLFAKETSDDITQPHWGKVTNSYLLAQCKGDDKDE